MFLADKQTSINSSPPECRRYVSVNWADIGSGNGLLSVWRQAITWTNAVLLSIGPLVINFSEIWIKIQNFHSWKYAWICRLRNDGHFVHWEMSKGSKIRYVWSWQPIYFFVIGDFIFS